MITNAVYDKKLIHAWEYFFAMLLITFIPNIQLKHIFEATFLEYYSQTFISARDFSAIYVRFMCVLCVAHDKQILKRDCGIRNVLIACAI